MKNFKDIICVIILRNEAAIDAFCAGQEDLEYSILPEKIGVKPEDVEVRFVKIIKGGATIDLTESDAKIKREAKNIVENS